MTRRTIDHLVASVYAAACFGAVLAPALAVRWTVFRSDVGGIAGRDVVAASVLVGAGHAAVAWTRLRCEKRTAVRRSHIWIASLNALVVLALAASLLVLGVLEHFAVEHAAMANRGLPVVALWTGLQLAAVALAEATGRFVFWWLEPHPQPHRACRWGVLPPAHRLLRRAAVPRLAATGQTGGGGPVPPVPVPVPVAAEGAPLTAGPPRARPDPGSAGSGEAGVAPSPRHQVVQLQGALAGDQEHVAGVPRTP